MVLKRDWQKDVVYLVQFPRTRLVPSASPFALKLETYLRFAGINYKNISNEFTRYSSKGQIPFIEMNGREIADSNLVISFLEENHSSKHIDQHLSANEKADAQAYNSLIEQNIFWYVVYSRSKNIDWFATSNGFADHVQGVKKFFFKNFMLRQLRKNLVKKCRAQGIGVHKVDEVVEMCKNDLRALSTYLDGKKYLTGDKPVKVDATAFGHLCQLYYTPQCADIKTFMEQETKNLVDYLNRIKKNYWTDWDDATKNISLDTNWKDEKYTTNSS
jgi:glutathione S-transferase